MPHANKPIRAVVLGDTSMSAHHGCELVMENLRKGLARIGVDVVCEHSGKGWRQATGVLESLRAADLLVVNGEGTMHHDRPQGYEFVDAAEEASRCGVPGFLVNCTWQQNSADLAQRARVFRRIFVRESRSAQELAEHGVFAKVIPDLTFATDWTETGQIRQGWLVTDSTIPAVTRELVRHSRKIEGVRLVPVTASECPRMTFKRRVRYHALRTFGTLMDRGLGWITSHAALSTAVPNAQAFLEQLSQSNAMLTGRFHAVCFAILTGTPFLAVRSNSSKIESLLKDAGLSPGRMVSLEVPSRELGEQLRASGFTQQEAVTRAQFVRDAKASIADMFGTIQKDLAQSN